MILGFRVCGLVFWGFGFRILGFRAACGFHGLYLVF